MLKRKYLVFLLMLFILFSSKAYASCTESELKEFNDLESKIKATYYIENNQYIFKIYNPAPTLFKYDIYSTSRIKCEVIDENNITCVGTDKINYDVIVIGKNCKETVKAPEVEKYNKFSESELCNGIEKFALCQPDYEKELTEEEFKSRVETYKKSLTKDDNSKDPSNGNKDNNSKNNEDSISFIDKIIDYINSHLVIIIAISIFAILATVTIILKVKTFKKSRRLE